MWKQLIGTGLVAAWLGMSLLGGGRIAAAGPAGGVTLARAGMATSRGALPAGLLAVLRRTLGQQIVRAAQSRNAAFPDAGWHQQAEVIAADGAANDFFGFSVALGTNTAVVGAYGHNSKAGAAYVFVRSGSTWSQQAELTATDTAPSDTFGTAVALSGNTALVGAPGHNSNAGAAYVFVRSGTVWTQQAEITATDGAANDAFGAAVGLAGSTAVVGAPARNGNVGASYVFVRSGSTWSQQAELTAADGASGDYFGYAVAPGGNTVAVTSPGRNNTTGAAYIFVRSGTAWSQQAELTAGDGTANDAFGASAAFNEDTAVVGAPGKNNGTGAAYVLTRSGTAWSQQAELTATHGAPRDAFGYAVAVSENMAMVGAPVKHRGAGAAYVFMRSGTAWTQRATLTAADGAPHDNFGFAVAVTGSSAVIGAINKNGNSGAAYIFVRGGTS